MVDTVGEINPKYQTVEQKAQGTQPNRNKGVRASVLAFMASLGILGGQIAGADPVGKTFDAAQDTKSAVSDVGQAVDARLNRAVNDMDGKPLEKPVTPPSTSSNLVK